MLFTIVVPTYNPRPFLPQLLDSIKTNECYKDIEIILSDDLSTEPFEDILENYSDMNIRIIKNDQHYGFPGWGKQHGLEEAQGTWICFSDQDDEFTEKIFDQLKEIIIEEKIKNYIITNFYIQYNDEARTLEPVIESLNWTHGKFYEREFLLQNNIRYQNYHYCEDINFSNQVNLVLHEKSVEFVTAECYSYIWHRRENSLSDSNNFSGYFFHSFPEYMDGTIEMYLQAYEKNQSAEQKIIDFYQEAIEETLYYYYFYLQGLSNPIYKCPPIPEDYYKQIAGYIHRYKRLLQKTLNEFIVYVYEEKPNIFSGVRSIASRQIPFVEYITFKDWLLNIIAPLEPED